MTLLLGSRPVKIIIQNPTPLEVSEVFLSLAISGNALDESGWYRPKGQIVLGVPQELGSGGMAVEIGGVWVPIVQGAAESFDCRVNPGRWAPGNEVSVSVWLDGGWVPLPWRLRILAYPNRPMPGNQRITLEVGTDADLLNYRTPEGDPGTDEYGTPTEASTLINRALAQAGAPALVTGAVVDTLRLPFSPEKNTGGSWITYAGSVAFAARHILWQRGDGAIVPTPVTLDGLTPVAAYTVGEDEADYILEAPGEQPPETVEVQGTTYLVGAVEDENYVTEEVVDGILVRTTVSYRNRDTASPEYEERVEMPANVVLPLQLPGFTGLITESRVLKTTNYNADTFILESEVEEVFRPVAIVFPNSIWPNPETLVVAERTTVNYTYDSRKVMTRRTTERRIAAIEGSTVTTAVELMTMEDWTPSQVKLSDAAKVPGEEYFFSRTQVNFNQDTARAPGVRGASTNNTPPETQYRPAEKQRNEAAYKGSAKFTNAVGSSFADKKWVISLPSGMGVSDDQCRAHAALWGKIRQGRQFQIKWSGDLTADWLTDFSPIRRVDFTLNGITTAYLVEAFNIAIDQRSAAVGGLGLEIGQVDGVKLVPPYVMVPDVLANGAIQISGGAVVSVPIAATVGGVVQLSGGAVAEGVLSATAGAVVQIRGGASLNAVPAVRAGGVVQLRGGAAVSPIIGVSAGATVQLSGGASVAEPPAYVTYLRPDGTSEYRRPDGTSTYERP